LFAFSLNNWTFLYLSCEELKAKMLMSELQEFSTLIGSNHGRVLFIFCLKRSIMCIASIKKTCCYDAIWNLNNDFQNEMTKERIAQCFFTIVPLLSIAMCKLIVAEFTSIN